jgi:hypothetical protein
MIDSLDELFVGMCRFDALRREHLAARMRPALGMGQAAPFAY